MAGEEDNIVDNVDINPSPDRRTAIAEQFAQLENSSTSENVSRETNNAQNRDTSGKFVAKESVLGAPVPKGGEVTPQAASPPEEPLWKRPPASWKKDFHDVWAGADPRMQQYAYQREEQMRAGIEPLLPKAQLADAITKVSEPFMNTIRGMGIDLPTAVEGLMKADHQLRTLPYQQKIQYLAGIAKSYGIDLGQMAPAVQGAQQQPAQDPNFYALQNELVSLKGEIGSWKQQQEAAQEALTLSEINKFAPTVEHFEEVRPTMIQLLQSGVADDLPDAYKKAIRLNDELFQADQTRSQAEAAQKQIVAKNMAAKSAKAAAGSVKGSTPGAAKPTNAKDRRSVIAEQFDSLSERL